MILVIVPVEVVVVQATQVLRGILIQQFVLSIMAFGKMTSLPESEFLSEARLRKVKHFLVYPAVFI
ncbi:hypothetical protein COU18_02620 [Candidatus Kaiserbacteria bacterium CG10_big_fil_rev_8_21_14_0_10_51_14]|uniref:Uncharacterized protein n=1 Tax=Candidatus Kaiserbacteria bacterium CG10_big_fil_rev_8_21_14_0_10_51_14 TaxID=1974610 RepID=A0A2H0UAV2_9BACT|nr:MAG: hypothetical protein COU18_02620 [Candidatus Kaiserbacteria bacterium CG10_big_fil_rev_8_21_14_0_10_51_14]